MKRWNLAAGAALMLVLSGCTNSHNMGGMGDMGGTGAGGVRGTSSGPSGTVPPGVSTGTATRPTAGAQTVNVTLTEYGVQLDRAQLPAGPIHLMVNNQGQRPHQFEVYPTSSATADSHQMAMAQGGVMPGAVGYLALVPPGVTTGLDVSLPAGSWELACHLQDSENGAAFDHYDRGMKTTLSVQAT